MAIGNSEMSDGGPAAEVSGNAASNTSVCEEESDMGAAAAAEADASVAELEDVRENITETQRARMERQRRQAQALAKARLARRRKAPKVLDTGGGFLLEEEQEAAEVRAVQPAAPAQPGQQPRCLRCGAAFAQSFLFDTFEYPACEPCRAADAPDGELALVARTDGKKEFLLQDCDLDQRAGPLPALRRRNPHAARSHMRLYLRAQLRERARLVWGGDAELAAERARRDLARARAAAAARARALAALRRDLRPPPPRAAHVHRLADERCDGDQYSRACLDCPYVETYEKM